MVTPLSSGPTDGVIREDRVTYASAPHSVTLARRRVARLVEGWEQPAIAGNVAVVVSEMTSNAYLHAAVSASPTGVFLVHLRLTAAVLRVEVTDCCTERLPEAQEVGDEAQFGRGLTLIGALSTRWGVVCGVDEKTVWAEFDVS